jgi:hypothetical protein
MTLLHAMVPIGICFGTWSCWRDILGWQGHDSQRKESATDYENMYAEIEAALVDVSKYTSLSSRHMETARVEQRDP